MFLIMKIIKVEMKKNVRKGEKKGGKDKEEKQN
jgi:hypothetical protein